MEEQLSIVRKEAERKKTLEEASKSIRQAISIIKEGTDLDYFVFFPLPWSANDILTYMHDNQLEKLKLHIKPQTLRVSSPEGNIVNIKTVEDLIERIKNWHKASVALGAFFGFECNPNILQNPDVELGDAFHAVSKMYRAHGILEPYDYVIEAFDNTILEELKETIDAILRLIFKSLMSKHEISFSSADKSKEILRKLQNEVCSRDSIEKLLLKLSDEICDRKLSAIQKDMFLRT